MLPQITCQSIIILRSPVSLTTRTFSVRISSIIGIVVCKIAVTSMDQHRPNVELRVNCRGKIGAVIAAHYGLHPFQMLKYLE